MSSDYPSSLDPAVPTLRDDVDGIRANALQHIADIIVAAQTQLGVGLGDTTSDPGYGASKKFGNLSQALQTLFSFETGEIDLTYNPSTLDEAQSTSAGTVNFTFNRFREAPFVMIQTIECNQDTVGSGTPSTNGHRESKIYPVNITNRKFEIAVSNKAAITAAGAASGIAIKAHWLAFEPPFGYAVSGDSATG